ncbi:MAG: NAD(P)H-dependent oxidoreductase [Pseudomonadota bacterium]
MGSVLFTLVPAMLKGWFDRVFTNGWAYDVTESGVAGRLKDRPVNILALGATDEAAYNRHGYEQSFKTQVEYGVFSYCGLKQVSTHVFFSVIDADYGGDPEIHLSRAAQLGESFAKRVVGVKQVA